MRAILYLRNSTDRQARAATIDAQRPDCRALAARLGAEETTEYAEEGVSGAASLDERPRLRALLRDVGEGDVVVAFALDRLCRSEDLIDRAAIYGALQRAGAHVETVLDGTVDSSTMGGRILHAIREEVAAEERRKIRSRTAAGKRAAIEQGRKPQGATPYGLRYDRATKVWSVDEPRADAMRTLFGAVGAGATCAATAARLEAAGYPTPRGPRWTARMVWQLVTRSTYRGEWIFGGKAIHVPALVDAATWQAAQAQLLAAGRRGLRRTQHVYLLDEGVGRCEACAGPLHVRWGGTEGRMTYYLCPNRACGIGWHRTDLTDAEVWRRIVAALRRPDLVARAVEDAGEHAADAETGDADAAEFERRAARLVEVEAAILSRFRRGLISEVALDREIATIARERTLLEQSAQAAREAAVRARSGMAAAQTLREAAAQLATELGHATPETRRELVRALRPDVRVSHATVAIAFRLRAPVADVVPIGIVRGTCSCTESHCDHDLSVEIAVVA